MTDFLGPILQRKRREIERRKQHRPIHVQDDGVSRVDRAVAALRRHRADAPGVIAEIKRRSPSAGAIRPRARHDVQDIARAYVAGGAAAVSVLCDGPGFGGSPLDVRQAARAVDVPILFKEFVLDPIQIPVARATGASMVLLLVRALDVSVLLELTSAVTEAGMAPVVEAANRAELATALDTGATIVGVNARNLKTFQVDTEAAFEALANVPEDRVAVHMSGISTADDIRRAADSRADAVLVGEALMRAEDPGQRLSELLG